MSILRSENDTLVSLLTIIAGSILKNTNKKCSVVNATPMAKTAPKLVESILSNYYKNELTRTLAVNPNVSGIIKPKPDSWIQLIDLSTYTPNMERFNLPPVNADLYSNLVTRLTSEIDRYHNIVNNSILEAIKNVNDYKSTVKPAKNFTDLFHVNSISIIDSLELIRDKGLLAVNLAAPKVNHGSLVDIKGILPSLSNVENITNDPELLLTLKEDITTMNSEDVSGDIMDILTGDIVENIMSVGINDVNLLIVLAGIMGNKMRSLELSSKLYTELNTVMAVLSDVIDKHVNSYKWLEKNDILIINFKNSDGITYLNVLDSVYNKYRETVKSNKAMVGAYLSQHVQSKHRDIKDVVVTVNIGLSAVLNNADTFVNTVDTYNDSLLLTRRNEDASKLRSYFIFGVLTDNLKANITSDEVNAVTEYIRKASLAELGDTENTVINIYKKFLFKNSNLSTFLEAMEEGKFLLNSDNSKNVAGYAALKLITLYLAGQTHLV